jgi:hypothetical protein
MHLVEILLPVTDNQGRPFAASKLAHVREHLTAQFGGVTAFTRAPAQGTTGASGKIVHDDIVVFEVMVETLDRGWWTDYRRLLEKEFEQDEVMMRASDVTRL